MLTDYSFNLNISIVITILGILGIMASLSLAGENIDLQPHRQYGPIEAVSNDDITQDDMQVYVGEIVDRQGLVRHNIDGFNEFIDRGLSNILQQLFKINRLFPNINPKAEESRQYASFRLNIDFSDVYVGMPYHVEHSGELVDLYPHKARLTGIPYSAPMYMNGVITVTAITHDDVEDSFNVQIGEFSPCMIPIMTQSSHCHTNGLSPTALKFMKEDPKDVGGAFLLRRQEFIMDGTESSKYNEVGTHFGDKNELVRSEFISQPPNEMFGNSSQIKVSYMAAGLIAVEINSVKFSNAKIPFYLVYHLLGMTSGKQIVKTIVYDLEDDSVVTQRMLQILDIAFAQTNEKFASLQYETDREAFIRGMAEKMTKYTTGANFNRTTDKEKAPVEMYVNQDVLENMDNVFLPHMGKTKDDRTRKLRFLGMVIRKTLLVHLKVMDPSDRDSYSNKRLHGPGICYPKLFKTLFHSMIILPAINGYRKLFKNTSWKDIKANPNRIRETFNGVLQIADLTKGLEQGITSSNKTIMSQRRALTNRVTSKLLERKNDLNVKCLLRSVTTHGISNASKQTERADKVRRVQSTQLGYTCPAHSADSGEKVGINRNMAVTAKVTSAENSLIFKEKLLQDADVIALDNISSEDMYRNKMALVYINGELIGCCKLPHVVIDRYRRLRREGRVVDKYTTITWDERENEVKFWLDAGRLIRPLQIVDNNLAEFEAAQKAGKPIKFIQNVRLQRSHIVGIKQGRVTLDDLVEEGLVEYVAPEEQENCLVAQSLRVLRERRHDHAVRYTHCDVEIAIMGLAALLSPYANRTQTARITYETNQGRQTCSWYSLAYPFRADKNRAFQYFNQIPLVKTFTNKFVTPSGSNLVVAYIANGSNQEDSADFCMATTDRGMFGVAYFKTETVELQNDEEFLTPDPINTKNMKVNGNYKKLVNGVVERGTIIEKGDILIGVVVKNNKQRGAKNAERDKYEFVDKSLMYKSEESAVVAAVIQDRGAGHEKFVTVVLRYDRPASVGDKLSSRSGNKSICAILRPQGDMPYTASGITPDIIVNPHSIPSRMTIGQLLETMLGKVCARTGKIEDGTAFREMNLDNIPLQLMQAGFRHNGKERLFNGETGEHYDADIFVGIMLEQRLQKFIKDNGYAVSRFCPTDAKTGQPLGGKAHGGGLRIGEMEDLTLNTHGALMTTYEKWAMDSDRQLMYVCRRCGFPAVYNARENLYRCRLCKDHADISEIETTRGSIVHQHELAAANIKMRFGLRAREFEEIPDTESVASKRVEAKA
jgi:DNA-directed RNA polymerase beta subunit